MTVKIKELTIKADFSRSAQPAIDRPKGDAVDDAVNAQSNSSDIKMELSKKKKISRER